MSYKSSSKKTGAGGPGKAAPGAVLWFTGLSGSGKTTLINALHGRLVLLGREARILDGDALRRGLCSDLGYGESDRKENVRRAAWMARFLAEAGHLVLCGFITPYRESRGAVRDIMSGLPYGECYVKCCLSECVARDPKGLYGKALRGEILGMSGLDAPFEEPTTPDLTVQTEAMDVDGCISAVMAFLYCSKMLDSSAGKILPVARSCDRQHLVTAN
jgi:adenylyl-sulfate kinase